MKKLLILIIVVVLIIVAFKYGKPSEKSAAPETAATDTTASIDEDLNAISADGEFEADMQSLDSDINSL